MTIGAVRIKKSELDNLVAKDSKQCSENQLLNLYSDISENYDTAAARIYPKVIDSRIQVIYSMDMNLNDLECYYMLALVNNFIIRNKRVDTVLIDNMDRSKEAFMNRTRKIMRAIDTFEFDLDDIDWSVRHKYDETSKLVGAGSIVAKYWRDREMEHIRVDLGEDVGSGQVSDPATQKYVFEHLQDKENSHIRFSWKTVDRLKNSRFCPKCGSNAAVKWGEGYKCAECQHTFTVEEI